MTPEAKAKFLNDMRADFPEFCAYFEHLERRLDDQLKLIEALRQPSLNAVSEAGREAG